MSMLSIHDCVGILNALFEGVGVNEASRITGKSKNAILITGKRNNAVLVAAEGWAAIQETLYLLSVPSMRESIKAA